MRYPDPQKPEVMAVPLSQIVPDRYQARLAIPPEIKDPFFAGQVDCYEAAKLLLDAADSDPGLSRSVESLLKLGQSILNERQIEPATGMWVDTESGLVFVLETGERRFWGLALEATDRQMGEEPKLLVIPQPGNSRQRQVAENFIREDLCAVETGKAVATMILESLDIFPEENENELEYYRKALKIQRLPAGIWAEISRLTGSSRPVLYRHLCILSLPDDMIYLATLHRLPERVLRDIVTAPQEQQKGMITRVIEERLRSAETMTGAKPGDTRTRKHSPSEPGNGPYRRMASQVLSLVTSISKQGEDDHVIDEVVNELTDQLSGPADFDAVAIILSRLTAGLRKAKRQRQGEQV